MKPRSRPSSRKIALTSLLLASLAVHPLAAHDGQANPLAETPSVDRIVPGTRIQDRAPRGFSHLVLKARSRLTSGAVNSLPDFAKSLAELLFTAIVARVTPRDEAGSRQFRLDSVAVGLGIRVRGQDTIISRDTLKALDVSLSVPQTMVLSQAEKRLDGMRRLVASGTMTVIDAPTVMLLDGRNQDIILRYCFLVHPADGRLASLVWPMQWDTAGRDSPIVGKAVLMRGNLVATTALHVDPQQITAGIPWRRAFGATGLPPGENFEFPPSLRALAERRTFDASAGEQLERQLRQIVRFPQN
jgi:hypothetical protein